MDNIEITGARTHNLKNINLTIPRDKLIVITGLSGSGKSSLAFNTIYAEGHRRYVESLSTYARQFLSLMQKPDVDHIEGLSPSISIEQKSISYNPRSTVGTITTIYDYLRLLFARIGEPHCPDHHIPLTSQTISQMVDNIMILPEGKSLMLLAPLVKKCKGEYSKLLNNLITQGYIRARINGKIYNLSDQPKLELHKKHTIEVVVDRFKVRANLIQRLVESFEIALELSGGTAIIVDMNNSQETELIFSSNFACPVCYYSINELEPHIFSFNNPAGACSTCNGLGVQQFFDPNLVIENDQISLVNGAIHGWDQHNFYYFQMLLSLAKHYKFDIKDKFSSLDPIIKQLILYGSGKEVIEFRYQNNYRDDIVKYNPFEGIINNIERRYKETNSITVRKKLAKYINNRSCISCHGTRLQKEARYVFIKNTSLTEISNFNIGHAMMFFKTLQLSRQHTKIAEKILKEIKDRLKFLINMGLSYLTLSRPAETLSGGESQRIRLTNQIGSGLVGVIYIIDEPSIGLHQRDNNRLLQILLHLRNLGNTVIIVEHNEDTIRSADHIIDIGPGAGIHGGHIVAQGNLDDIIKNPNSLTGKYLSGKYKILIPKKRVSINTKKILKLIGAQGNNLKNITLELPVGLFICITGVSGSGKSTLINNTLFSIAQNKLNKVKNIITAPYTNIEGLEFFDKVININQHPIGRTPRSNPATYTGIFKIIRELFSSVHESRVRGHSLGRFSFNLKGGRCEACQGDGMMKVKMHFLPDTYVFCDYCNGKRYNRETLEIKYKGKNIHEILKMTIQEAHKYFEAIPILVRKLQTLIDVGLSYISLGQAAITLSGGEAQRIKLSRELSKRNTGKTLYILDEPTTGLHFADIKQLLNVLYKLRDQGNTIVIIEHNLDVIKTADWIVDLGPEGGNSGGRILFAGIPEQIIKCKKSHTGKFLNPIIKRGY
ncbi:MAG: excinuclease ABC subunit UvrA [Arsenophonus sp. ER-QC15-MAG3]